MIGKNKFHQKVNHLSKNHKTSHSNGESKSTFAHTLRNLALNLHNQTGSPWPGWVNCFTITCKYLQRHLLLNVLVICLSGTS